MINSINSFVFKEEFNFGESIQNSVNSQSYIQAGVISRIQAIFISAICLLAFLTDLVYITWHLIGSLVFSITHCKSPFEYCSNTRNIIVVIVEFVRHLFGTIAGSILGVILPETARSLFLPHDQSALETRADNMTTEESAKLYAMLEIVDDLFKKEGIPYCMTGGTQLGLQRHGGIIPWDDDADLAILLEDKEKVFKLEETLEKRGLGLVECPGFGFKIYDLKGKPLPSDNFPEKSVQYNYPFVDICLFREIDGKYVYNYENFRTHYAGEYFLKEQWASKEKQSFGPIELIGLPEEQGRVFCIRTYGEDCFNHGFQVYNHKKLRIDIPKKIYLKQDPITHKCKPIDFDNKVFTTVFREIS